MGHTSQAYQYRRSSDAETICNVLVALIGDVGSKSADMGNGCLGSDACQSNQYGKVSSLCREGTVGSDAGRRREDVRPEGKGLLYFIPLKSVDLMFKS